MLPIYGIGFGCPKMQLSLRESLLPKLFFHSNKGGEPTKLSWDCGLNFRLPTAKLSFIKLLFKIFLFDSWLFYYEYQVTFLLTKLRIVLILSEYTRLLIVVQNPN